MGIVGLVAGTLLRLGSDAYTPMSMVVALTCIAVPAFIAWRLVLPFDDVDRPDPTFAPRPSAGVYPASFAIATPALCASVAVLLGAEAPNRGDLGSALAGAVVGVVVTYPFAYGFVRDAQSPNARCRRRSS